MSCACREALTAAQTAATDARAAADEAHREAEERAESAHAAVAANAAAAAAVAEPSAPSTPTLAQALAHPFKDVQPERTRELEARLAAAEADVVKRTERVEELQVCFSQLMPAIHMQSMQ